MEGHDHAEHAHHSSHARGDHALHSPDMFKRKFWISLLLTLPTVLFSGAIQAWLHVHWVFTGSSYIPAVFGLILFGYGGWVFLKSARSEIAARRPGMMTLISMAITVALGYSLAVTLGIVQGMDFWWELATLITIMLLGHWLEMASVQRAENALHELAKLLPDTADVVSGGTVRTVALASVRVGDAILVRPGSRVAVDGEVIEGESDVDESLITGESRPVHKTIYGQVIAGSMNGSGSLTVSANKVSNDTALAGIMRLVADAQASKSNVQILADRAASYLTFIALGSALVTLLAWGIAGQSAGFILTRVVTVLIIACPHALGLAIPLVIAIAAARGAQSGLLIRDRQAFEAVRNTTYILFDKTGTLTAGRQAIANIWTAKGYTASAVLQIAASIEQASEHGIGTAIVQAAHEQGIALKPVASFAALPGSGVRGTVGHSQYTVASRRHAQENGVHVPKALGHSLDAATHQGGKTIVLLIKEQTAIGALALADQIRPESREAIARLTAMGITCGMITGDAEAVAAYTAKQLGLQTYFAEVKPQDKSAKVRELQMAGHRVAMVGDGINDAPAIAQADAGIAIGAGTDVAAASAGIILAGSDPRGVVTAIELSRATYRKMLQNLAWATGYNVLAIPLAAGATAALGFTPSPALGAVLMSLSTIIVAVNAQTLRRAHM